MKGKLIKKDENYFLEVDFWYPKYIQPSIIANTFVKPKGEVYDLCRKNCDEIFGVVDVEKLAEDFAKNHSIYPTAQDDTEYGFKNGFNKAVELNGDKEFTLEDMRRAIAYGENHRDMDTGKVPYQTFVEFIQSLQQLTQIEVEIETEPCFYDDSLGGFSTSYTVNKPKEQPKLDTNGNLILRKI
jgi:hypothetical protein